MSSGESASLERSREGGAGSLPSALLLVVAVLLVPGLLAYGLATTEELKVMAVVVAVLGALLVLARPFWGLAFFVALLFFRPEELLPALQGTHLSLAVALLTLVATWFQFFLKREKPVHTPLNMMILGFGTIAVLSTLGVGTTAEAAQDIGKLVSLVFLILYIVRTRSLYRSFVTAIILFSVYLACYSIYRYFTGGVLEYEGGGVRTLATGIFGDPNDLAGTIVAVLALVLARVSTSRGFMRGVYSLLAGLMVWAIFLTNSRGGMLALLLVCFGFFMVFVRQKWVGLVLALVIGSLLLVAGPSRMRTFDRTEESANERFWYWDTALWQLRDRPLTGVGYRQFPDYNGGKTAHNSFVLCFAELGLPGYFFWMGCIYYCFRRRPRGDLPQGEGVDEEDDEEARRDLLGARLALAGFLAAGFWISRTYVAPLYLLLSLPIAAQLAASGGREVFPFKFQERVKDWGWIGLICLGSILFIFVLVQMCK
jgi:hypothetical protein